MRRLLVLVILYGCVLGCETTSPSAYTFYEVVRTYEQLNVGDTVVIETSDGERFRGVLLRASAEEVVITTENQGRVRVLWHQVKSAKRVVKAEAEDE